MFPPIFPFCSDTVKMNTVTLALVWTFHFFDQWQPVWMFGEHYIFTVLLQSAKLQEWLHLRCSVSSINLLTMAVYIHLFSSCCSTEAFRWASQDIYTHFTACWNTRASILTVLVKTSSFSEVVDTSGCERALFVNVVLVTNCVHTHG